MKDSEYFFLREAQHLQVADNPCFDAWIRAANRDHARRCRQSAQEALEVEAREARIAETDDRDEQLSLQAEIDEIRYNQENRYENAR